jgi:hypothetical protein
VPPFAASPRAPGVASPLPPPAASLSPSDGRVVGDARFTGRCNDHFNSLRFDAGLRQQSLRVSKYCFGLRTTSSPVARREAEVRQRDVEVTTAGGGSCGFGSGCALVCSWASSMQIGAEASFSVLEVMVCLARRMHESVCLEIGIYQGFIRLLAMLVQCVHCASNPKAAET